MPGVKSKRAAPRAQPERKCKNAKVGGTASSAAQPKPMKCGAGVKLESHPSDWILDVLIGNNRYSIMQYLFTDKEKKEEELEMCRGKLESLVNELGQRGYLVGVDASQTHYTRQVQEGWQEDKSPGIIVLLNDYYLVKAEMKTILHSVDDVNRRILDLSKAIGHPAVTRAQQRDPWSMSVYDREDDGWGAPPPRAGN